MKCFYLSNNLLSVFFKARPNLGLYTKAYLNYNQVLIAHCIAMSILKKGGDS